MPLAEALLEANGAAAAVWASAGLTEMAPQLAMNLAAVNRLFESSPAPRLGVAIRAALATTTDPDVRATWVLLGDPTMKGALEAGPAALGPWMHRSNR